MAYQVIEAVEFKSETFPKSSLGGATYQQQYSTSEPTQLKQGTQTSSSFYEVILAQESCRPSTGIVHRPSMQRFYQNDLPLVVSSSMSHHIYRVAHLLRERNKYDDTKFEVALRYKYRARLKGSGQVW